ncbi:MAG: MoaD/ThiS family protein [Candidatus Hadarchaeaceae archaeon]
MEVVVRLSDELRKQTGTEQIKIPIDDDETVDTLLMKLSRRHPKLIELVLDPTTGEAKGSYEILINGRRIRHLRGIYTKLKHKDEVLIAQSEPESS